MHKTKGLGRLAQLVCLVMAVFCALSLAAPVPALADVESVKGKTYRITTDTTFAPFEYRDSNGDLVGIDMDLIRAIAEEEGFNVEIESLGFNAAMVATESGNSDMTIAGASITDERKQTYDFSDPYFDSGVLMAVPESSDITGYQDLKGKKVVVKTGTEGETFAKSIQDQYGFDIVSVDQTSTMVQMLQAGQADAMFDDYPIIAYGIAQGNGMKSVTQKEAGNSYGAVVAKGKNQDLLQAFNEGLAKLKADGRYDQIMEKYLGDNATKAEQTSFFGLLQQSAPALLTGVKNTLLVTVVAFAGALVLGILFGLMKISGSKILRAIASFYVWLFRGTPLLIWAFFFYFALPQVAGVKLSVFAVGALALALNAGSYITEIVRGAIQSVDPGQTEAARCLGCSSGLTMRAIVFPQAAKIATPSLINQLIIMVKDSSILLAIGFGELLYQAQQIYAANLRVSEVLFIVAMFYLVTISLLTMLANWATRRFSENG